jgi:hypothetical protein
MTVSFGSTASAVRTCVVRHLGRHGHIAIDQTGDLTTKPKLRVSSPHPRPWRVATTLHLFILPAGVP